MHWIAVLGNLGLVELLAHPFGWFMMVWVDIPDHALSYERGCLVDCVC